MRHLVLVSGYSGAGKSVALKALADLGYEAIDNIPLQALGAVIDAGFASSDKLAICSDARSRDFSPSVLLEIKDKLLAQGDIKVDLVFLSCDKTTLMRRFTETRHLHPLATDRPVIDGIRLEYELLHQLRHHFDHVIDTSEMGPHDLKRALSDFFGRETRGLKVNLVSFSFRRGVPRDADMVIDARFLANPHYIDTLRPLNGKDAPVQAFIAADPNYSGFMDKLLSLIDFLLPLYKYEGKTHFTLAVGCTGGKHRSVFSVEALARHLQDQKIHLFLRHREIEG